nr:type II secretion system minor pseudopilin GspI [Atopomonas sediminilitoris]
MLEVLVALAIFATLAAVILVASGRSVNNAMRLEDKTLASWIADNRLQELQWQGTVQSGREQTELDYAGRRWQRLELIETTTEPGMLRVTVWVAPRPDQPDNSPLEERAVLSLVGFVGAGS